MRLAIEALDNAETALGEAEDEALVAHYDKVLDALRELRDYADARGVKGFARRTRSNGDGK